MSGVPAEPMITGGIEAIVSVVQEPAFGPVAVLVGGAVGEALETPQPGWPLTPIPTPRTR